MLWDLHAVRGTILRTVFVEPKNIRLDNTERICEEILKLGKDIYMKPFMDRQNGWNMHSISSVMANA